MTQSSRSAFIIIIRSKATIELYCVKNKPIENQRIEISVLQKACTEMPHY